MSRAHSSFHALEPRRLLDFSDLDGTFGDGGGQNGYGIGQIVDVGPQAVSNAAALQADGKLLIAGRQGSNAFLVRLSADGSLDNSFATNGVAKFDLGGNESFESIAVLPDGKILAAGNTATGARRRGLIARFRVDGTLDTNTRFGHGDGVELLKPGEWITSMTVTGSKIVTIGAHLRQHNIGSGTLDVGFAGTGQIDLQSAADLDEFIPYSVAVSPTGKLAVAGYGISSDPTEKKFPQRLTLSASNGNCAIVVTSTGALDNSFDTNGVAFYDGTAIPKIIYATDGTLLVADVSRDFTPTSGPGLFRMQADGTTSFTLAPGALNPDAIGILPGGQIMIAGGDTSSRFNADGSLDLTFSNDGTAAPSIGDSPPLFYVYGGSVEAGAAVIAPDGAAFVVDSYSHNPQAPEPIGPVLVRKLQSTPFNLDIDVHLQNDGTLMVRGSADFDDGGIETDSGELKVDMDQQRYAFAVTDVTGVSVTLGDENDGFNAEGATMPVTIDGGNGMDTLEGGSGNDVLIWGANDDTLIGDLGNDSLYGGGSDDTLMGGPGADYIDGGRADDIIYGGSSNDRLIGGSGIDYIYGEGGDDRIYSDDTDADHDFGGSGKDTAYIDTKDVLESIEIRGAFQP